jgi:hypothetical protein
MSAGRTSHIANASAPGFLTTSLGYWRTAGVVLNFFCVVEAVAVFTECGIHAAPLSP